MARRHALRPSDVRAALTACDEAGFAPTALEFSPDGRMRVLFTPQTGHDEDDLDRELREFEARHGQGRP